MIYEPLKSYRQEYEKSIERNAADFFDELVKKSKTKVSKNKETVAKYDEEMKKYEQSEKRKKRFANLKGLSIFGCVLILLGSLICAIYSIMLFYQEDSPLYKKIIFPILVFAFAALGVYCVLVVMKKFDPKIKLFQNKSDEHKEAAYKYLAEAKKQMEKLNSMFNGSMVKEVSMRTVPNIKIDPYFNMSTYAYLLSKKSIGRISDENTAVIDCLSGSIESNPFVFVRYKKLTMINKTYYGSITVTHHKVDSEGKSYTETEFVSACYVAPAPIYGTNTVLIYQNDAAPDLTFRRSESGIDGVNSNESKNFIDKKKKELRKYEKECLSSGKYNFTVMANEDFDALFGAWNRNNEVQYRLLFTPLAQINMMDLITSGYPYGDDFTFEKRRLNNYLTSVHMQSFKMDIPASTFQSYSLEKSKDAFIKECSEFFTSLYFDLAPILSIPLYQQYKSKEKIYNLNNGVPSRFLSPWEADAVANALPKMDVMPQGSQTEDITNTTFLAKSDDSDEVQIVSRSFYTVDRLTFVPETDSEGQIHDVPVHWVEYIPIERSTLVKIYPPSEDVPYQNGPRNMKVFYW